MLFLGTCIPHYILISPAIRRLHLGCREGERAACRVHCTYPQDRCRGADAPGAAGAGAIIAPARDAPGPVLEGPLTPFDNDNYLSMQVDETIFSPVEEAFIAPTPPLAPPTPPANFEWSRRRARRVGHLQDHVRFLQHMFRAWVPALAPWRLGCSGGAVQMPGSSAPGPPFQVPWRDVFGTRF